MSSHKKQNRSAAPTRSLPVRPDLDQLKHQAKDLLRAARRGEKSALEEFETFHPGFAGRRATALQGGVP